MSMKIKEVFKEMKNEGAPIEEPIIYVDMSKVPKKNYKSRIGSVEDIEYKDMVQIIPTSVDTIADCISLTLEDVPLRGALFIIGDGFMRMDVNGSKVTHGTDNLSDDNMEKVEKVMKRLKIPYKSGF